MSLAADITALRDRATAELVAQHDYYVNTRLAWKFVRREIAAGRRFRMKNLITGSVTPHSQLDATSRYYVATYLKAATFLQFVSTFESFLFDLLRLWLTAHPRSLAAKKVDLSAILDAPDKDAIVRLAVDAELNEVTYKRPAEWFAYLNDRLKLGRPTADDIDRVAEAKATRDIIAHAQGVAGKAYLAKAGRLARYNEGEVVELPDAYHRDVWQLFRTLVLDLADAAAAKG